MFSPSKLFSPSKESVVALSGTPLKSPSTKSSRKKKVIVEFPREWPEQSKRNNGNGRHGHNNYPRNGDVVGEPFHSIFEHEFHVRQEQQQHQHRFCAPFLLGMAVALVVIFIPSTAVVYWICQDVDVPSSSSLESSSSTSCVKVTTTTTTFMRPTPPTPAKRRFNFFKRLFSKEKSSPSSVVAVTKALSALPQQDPTTCACQLVWKGVERAGQLVSLRARNNDDANGPYPDQKCQGLDSTQRSPTTEAEGSLPSKTSKQHSQTA